MIFLFCPVHYCRKSTCFLYQQRLGKFRPTWVCFCILQLLKIYVVICLYQQNHFNFFYTKFKTQQGNINFYPFLLFLYKYLIQFISVIFFSLFNSRHGKQYQKIVWYSISITKNTFFATQFLITYFIQKKAINHSVLYIVLFSSDYTA